MARKKKENSLLDNEEVKLKRNELRELRKKYLELSNKIKKDEDSVMIDMPMDELSRRLGPESLPIENIKELCAFERGKRKSFFSMIKERDKILKESKKNVKELIETKNKIKIGEIDIILAKINAMMTKIS
jgi:hypothetical protein